MKCKNCVLYKNCTKMKLFKKKPWYKKLICKDYKPIRANELPPWLKDL